MNENKMKYLYTAAMVALTLIVGIAALFCIKKYDVHAEDTDELNGWIEVYSWMSTYMTSKGQQAEEEVIEYMPYADYNPSEMCLVKDINGNLKFYSPNKTNISEKFLAPESYGYVKTAGNWKHGNCLRGSNYVFNAFYIFDSEDTASGYIKGTVPATSALNYDAASKAIADIEKQIRDSQRVHDSTIPVPINAGINVITTSSVSSVFEYDEEEIKKFGEETGYTLMYEYSVEYIYQMLAKFQIEKQVSCISSLKFPDSKSGSDTASLNANGIIEIDGTCKDLYTAFKATNNIEIGSNGAVADSGMFVSEGCVDIKCVVTSSPPNYYELYMIPKSLVNFHEYHMQFVLAQAKIVTFYVDADGYRHDSDAIYIRRPLWENDEEGYGMTYTRITKDEDGNDIFQSSWDVDSNGKQTDNIGSIDDGNILQYVKNGFGLSGTDGYIALARHFFQGVPSSIWTLLAMALAVSIAVIVFKALRGM